MFKIDNYELIYIVRIIIAGICGIVIGIERKNRSKEAGIRTHFVVACGAALIMIVSKYAFFDVAGTPGMKVDASRVASSIVSGIGFLGAGMIFVHRSTITGLTTAAGIWATAGVGMAIGAGMIFIGVASTLVILIAQIVLHFNRWNKTSKTKKLSVKEVTEKDFQKKLKEILERKKISINDVSIEKISDDKFNYSFLIEMPSYVMEEEVLKLIEYKSSIKSVE